MYKKPLVILTGPTAVGKTELSIKLAEQINGEIISADSMQVYKYMNIGTAKIMPSEMNNIKHYLIDEFDPSENFNVVKFKEFTDKYIKQIYEKGKIPIITGGTGFYIQAVLYNILFEKNETDEKYRKDLEALAKEKGNRYLHDMLKEVDLASAEAIHANNIKRVIRALEYYKITGKRISEHNKEQKKNCSPYNFIYFVLTDDRQCLYDRIDKRVDKMISDGLEDEVKRLVNTGYNKSMVSMQGIGYKEMIDYIEGTYSLDEAVYTIKRETRHFAKRQITWFKREKEVTWINKKDFSYDNNAILKKMTEYMKEKNII